jgi:uncharacterized protein (TIGR03437 family)
LPDGLLLDGAGNIYISSDQSALVRKVAVDGTISTVAGGGTGCAKQTNSLGDGCPATSVRLDPVRMAIDANGDIYVADSFNGRIRLLSAGTAITLVGNAFGDKALVAPNTWLEIKGSHLAPVGDRRIWQGSDFSNNQMPSQLDGVTVTINGKKAFVYFISGTQVNVLSPPDAVQGSVPVQLSNGGATSASVNIQAQQYSPSFFVFDGTHVTATHIDGSLIGPSSLYPGFSTPAKPNETVIFYANGFGPTSASVVSGALAQSGTLAIPPVIKIGGLLATVQFAGLVSPGLFQFNVVIPSAVPDGDNVLVATYSGLNTQDGVSIAIQH